MHVWLSISLPGTAKSDCQVSGYYRHCLDANILSGLTVAIWYGIIDTAYGGCACMFLESFAFY